MKAMVLKDFAPVESNPLCLESLPIPSPGEGEVLIRVKACGVCHTDLHTVEGDLPLARRPIIPGHQIVGEVIMVGPGCSLYKVGVAWLYSTCGRCSFCLSGKENLCPEARFTGYHINGGYAEYMLALEQYVYPLRSEAEALSLAPLLCGGIIGYRALRLSRIKPGERLALFGFGASAHLALQVALFWGCEVYVFSRGDAHRRLAEEMGASWTGKAGERPPHPVQAAIIFAPAGELVPAALEVTARGGTVCLAGITMTDVPSMDYEKYLYHERILRSVANATRQDGQEFFELAEKIPLKTKIEVFSLDEANQALTRLKKGLVNGAAVLRIE